MSSITAIPDSYLEPLRGLSAAEKKVLFLDNDEGIRDLIYGSRAIEEAAPPHDHAENGGEVLAYHILSVSFPRRKLEDGTGTAALGIPLGTPQTGETFDSSNGGTSKLVASAPLFLPGGTRNLYVFALISWDGNSGGLDFPGLAGILSPYAWTNYKEEDSPSYDLEVWSSEGTISTGAAVVAAARLAWTANQLDRLGDPALDRELELRLFQNFDAPSGAARRLLGLFAVAGASPATRAADQNRDKPRAELQPVDILGSTGALTPSVTSTIRRQMNQHAAAALGLAPGVASNGESVDRRRTFRQIIERGHQHQGILVPEDDGSFSCDGAVIRRALVAQCFPRNLGENTSHVVDGDAYRGIRLHPSGGATLDGKYLTLRYRVPIPRGLGSLVLRFAAYAGTSDQRTAMTARAKLSLISGGSSIVTGMRTPRRSSHAVDASGFHYVEVSPLPNDAYPRPERGWTQAAKLQAAEAPEGVDLTWAYQISEPVEILLTHPAVKSTDDPHPTGDYELALRFDLLRQDAGVYDEAARLNWLLVVPGRGW
jgi:hypothetical protein